MDASFKRSSRPTDEHFVPRLALLVCCGLCLLLGGCVLGSSKGGDVIEKLTPTPSRGLGCFDEGIDGPPGRSCAMIATGSQADVVSRLVNGLHEQGFTTRCSKSNTGTGGIEVIGARPDLSVDATTVPAGFAVVHDGDAIFYLPGTRIGGHHVPIPAGSVGLTIDASEYTNSTAIGIDCADPSLLSG
jgi:hypothetical protein